MQFTLTKAIYALTIHAFLIINGQKCILTKSDLESHNHVFFLDKILMRQAIIPDDGTLLKLVCDSGNNDALIDDVYSCNRAVLNSTLPTVNCKNRFKPEIVIGLSSDCLVAMGFKLYKVGYKFDGEFTELYSSCYKAANMQVKYVKHTKYYNAFGTYEYRYIPKLPELAIIFITSSFKLATNRPELTFTTDRIISGADAASYGIQSVYARFVLLFGDNQGYVEREKDIVINRGHLAPSADFLFIENKKATFKYINCMPQFARVNNGNWKRIEEWVQKLGSNKVNVITGTIGVLQLPHPDDSTKLVPLYLGNNQKNPIPQWTFKVVNNFIFITYNNPYATELPDSIPCPPVKCPAIGVEADFRSGYTYCCSIVSLSKILNI